MAFRHGKNTGVFYNGADLSPYFNEASVSNDVEVAETTAFGDTDKQYIAGLRDGTLSAAGMFDGSQGAIDQTLSALIGAEAADVVTLTPDGVAVGRRAFSAAARQTSYEISSPVSDVVAASLEVQATDGVDTGVLLAARATVTALGNGANVDQGASSSEGGIGYLHVTSNTMDGATAFKVQDSADAIVFVDLITFTSVSASATVGEKITVTGSVDRYVRASHDPGASSGSVTYTLAFARK
jgi:hypothetical protein